jgi:site-specific recombinase XerD
MSDQGISKVAQQNYLAQNTEILISDVLDDFLNTRNSQHTIRSYKNDLSTYLNFLDLSFLNDLGAIQFPNLVEKTLYFIRSFENKDQHTDKIKNPKTVNRKDYAISAFFNYLIDVYSYPKNPIKQFHPHKTERKSTTESLSRAEAIDVLKYTQ